MKKILLATTALAATSGVAAADMAVTGFAEIGIFGGSGIESQLFTDVDVFFRGTGETDGGLAFGMAVDLDEVDDDDDGDGVPGFDDPDDEGGETIFISGNFGTLTWGDTDGAFDWAMTEVGIIDSINDDHTEHAGFSGNSGLDGTYDGQIVRYDYSFGQFAVGASVEMDDAGVGDPVWGAGATYGSEFGAVDVTAGLGYQSNGVRDIWGVSATAGLASGFVGRLNYSDLDGTAVGDSDTHIGVGVGYEVGAIAVAANWGQYDLVGGGDVSGWGLAANYDLGGGAVMQFGYGSSDPANTDTWSLGMALSF